MASVNSQRVRTRSQIKSTYPDISETTTDERLTQSTEVTSSVLDENDDEDLSKMESDGKKRRSPRKRIRRINSEDENEEERTATKVQSLSNLIFFCLCCWVSENQLNTWYGAKEYHETHTQANFLLLIENKNCSEEHQGKRSSTHSKERTKVLVDYYHYFL